MPIAVTLVQALFRQIWVEVLRCSLPVISRRPSLPAAYNVSLSLDVPRSLNARAVLTGLGAPPHNHLFSEFFSDWFSAMVSFC